MLLTKVIFTFPIVKLLTVTLYLNLNSALLRYSNCISIFIKASNLLYNIVRVLDPLTFANTSVTQTFQYSTHRTTGLPPVPCAAGFKNTRAPPNLPSCACGTVHEEWKLSQAFLSIFNTFCNGISYSLALPKPCPIIPFSFPTTQLLKN